METFEAIYKRPAIKHCDPDTQTMTKLRGIFTSEQLKQAITELF